MNNFQRDIAILIQRNSKWLLSKQRREIDHNEPRTVGGGEFDTSELRSRGSRPEVFCKIDVLCKIHGKTPVFESLF